MPQVLNGGLGTSKASTNRYYLSTDAIKSAGDVQLAGSRAVPLVAAGVPSDGHGEAPVGATMATTAYHPAAGADDAKATAEDSNPMKGSGGANASREVAPPILAAK